MSLAQEQRPWPLENAPALETTTPSQERRRRLKDDDSNLEAKARCGVNGPVLQKTALCCRQRPRLADPANVLRTLPHFVGNVAASRTRRRLKGQ
jgi:hypothetical protein